MCLSCVALKWGYFMKKDYVNLNLFFPAEGIAVVEINRPKQLNALDTATLKSISEFLQFAEDEKQINVIIYTGNGDKAFISGGDICEMAQMRPIEASNYSKLGHLVTSKMTASRIITIAAINGYALGGGLEFALACDIRIASNNAIFGLPEVTLGAVCGFGGSQRLPRTIGVSKAAEMLLTGKPITASEAMSWGLISDITTNSQETLPAAIELAKSINECSPTAVSVTKRLLHQGLQADIFSGLTLEQHAFWGVFSFPDRKEGMNAFLEKRKPNYQRVDNENN